MEFLYLLEKIRTPFLDGFFSLVTHLGEETFFLVFAILFFWCINKREGYYILTVGFVGTVINQILKLTFHVPRPWVKDPSFTIVESARAEAAGYSFPSGHTQNAAGTFGCIAYYSKKRILRVISVALIVLVSLSRMYLGVHTPLDVCASLVIALLLTHFLYPIFFSDEKFERYMPYVVMGCAVLSFAFLLYALFVPSEGHSTVNLESALKNSFTIFGCTCGIILVYMLDTKYIRFETKAPWYAQLLKLVLGVGVILGIKVGLSSPLTALFGNEYIARAVRYFLMVTFAGAIWPLTFKYFAKMRVKPLDAMSEKIKALFAKN